MNPINDLVFVLSMAPENEIAKDVTEKIRVLVGKPEKEIADGLLGIIGECGVYNKASDFAMMALNQTYSMVKAIAEMKESKEKGNEKD